MLVLDTIEAIQHQIFEWKKQGLTIGFVPTMGSLHEGHVELVRTSNSACDKTVVSVFVNATQFNDASDFQKYPRDIDADIDQLADLADIIFTPSHEEMYSNGIPSVHFNFGALETVMEGKYRAGHFNGVGTVVSKLFNIVQPDKAVFGQKDIQQYAIIQQLVRDLSFPIELICNSIIRNEKGLALSSRNKRLSVKGEEVALQLYKAINIVGDRLKSSSKISEAYHLGLECIKEEQDITLDYLEIVDAKTLHEVTSIQKGDEIVICIAAFVDDVRLIDNLLLSI